MLNVCLIGFEVGYKEKSRIKYKLLFVGNENDVHTDYYKVLPRLLCFDRAECSYIHRCMIGEHYYNYFYVELNERCMKELIEKNDERYPRYKFVVGNICTHITVTYKGNLKDGVEKHLIRFEDIRTEDLPNNYTLITKAFKINKGVGNLIQNLGYYNFNNMRNIV